ncbi:hypothetical protein LMH87_001078 [Akanthomyces muscarius]|uniref:Uncharacterized protein n=1 Tax=Akanthomyces muscarius TaxID=2231603 RepID=A0A9W8QI43_AKAMU|nr:hypothetical protein LMH87_001078 [Akanthomyces muscarius]KAJ4155852.1 hypothetical protein LMH87_001078 [Akanthomyces muscarius]
MRCLNLIPLAFCSLALAQVDDDFIAAILYGPDDYEFDVLRDRCVNLKKTQPIFSEIEVGYSYVCELYSELNCADKILEFPAGSFDIEELHFKSIQCEVPAEIAGN